MLIIEYMGLFFSEDNPGTSRSLSPTTPFIVNRKSEIVSPTIYNLPVEVEVEVEDEREEETPEPNRYVSSVSRICNHIVNQMMEY